MRRFPLLRTRTLRATLALGLFLASGLAAPVALAQAALVRHSLPLPGPPAVLLSTDLDGDGHLDLAAVVATTTWEEIGIEESAELDEVEGLVEVLTVVPALFDRRELHAFLAREGGGFEAVAGGPLELPPEVLGMAPGPPGIPLLALTDAGLAAVRLDEAGRLRLESLVEDPPVLARAGTFVPGLLLTHDLDGDGELDVLLPGRDGLAVYLAAGSRLELAGRLSLPLDERLPGDARHYRRGPVRHYPLPEIRDVDGDGRPDLLVANHQKGWNQFAVLLNQGGGRFGPPLFPLGDRPRDAEPEVVFFGDLDGDGRAEAVTEEQIEKGDEDASLRQELAEARRPRFRDRFHPLDSRLRMRPEPARTLETEGYAFAGDEDLPLPGGFQDLDGDGRADLVTLTVDFSLFEAVKILTVKRLSLDLDFHIWCQQGDGSFRPVPGLDLSGTFKVNLNNLRLGQLSLFHGDFDGDGRKDFAQLGRGRTVSIHRGRPGCVYPSRADLTVELAEEPVDLALVQIRDFDGDGRSDLAVTQPEKGPGEAGKDSPVTRPVRLDLYLSGGRP